MPASETPPLAQLGPSQFSEIRLRITASIDLYPADMDRPEIRQQQLSSHDWLTGWRIRGGVGSEAQQDRYALYSTDHHLQLRTMKRGWSINELVADVAGVIPRLRSVRLLVDRLDGLPAIQIAATTREDFQLVLPDNTPLRALPGHEEVEEEGDQGPVLHPQCCQGYRKAVKDIESLRPAVQYTIVPPNVILAQPALTPNVAVGGASADHTEHSRFYTIFEPRIDLRQRPADPSWQLADYVADAVRQLPVPVRMVFILSMPLPSFATPQLVLTLHSALPRARSLPVDLRSVGGMVHTIELLPQCSPTDVWAALRDKGIDLSRQWEAAHEAGHVRFLNQLGHEVVEWGADDDRLEWAELTATTAEWQESIITYGSTEAQALMDRFTSTRTTTAMGPSHEVEPRDPPTLLRALAPVDACSSHSLAGIQVLPAHLASQSLSTISAADLCLYAPAAPADDGTRPFTVFVLGNSPIIRTADPQWLMCRFLTEAMSISDQAVRQVQFLPLSMPDLPTPQFVITPTASLPGTIILPIDARELGGSICTVAVSEGEPGHSIMSSVATAQPNILQAIQALLAFDAVFLQDAAGQVWDSGPPESAASSWLALRCDQARLQQAPPSLRRMIAPATTSTTTAAYAAHGPEPILTVVLAGGGLLLRSVPLPLSQEPVISVAASMPRSAASSHHHMIGFIVTEMEDADREVVILQDPSMDGSLLSAVAIDRGTFIESMVAPAQARRGFAAALNGAPQDGARRHLITGDFIQIYQRPLAARTWPVAHMYSILPALRLFALPIRLPGARSFLGRLPANADRGQARRDLLQVIELRMLEQAMDLGEPGPGGYPVVVMGPAHVPMMVYVPEASPSHEATMRFLTYSGLFTPGTTYAATTALSGTMPIVVSIPPQDHLLTALYPTPDTTTTWLQLSISSEVSLHSLGLPVRRGMELVYPPRLTHATVLHERVARSGSRPPTRDPADMSLIQTRVQLSSAPRHTDTATATASGVAQQIPTPLGRRLIRPLPPTEPKDKDGQDRDSGVVQQIELSSLIPVPPPAITWEVNPEICDFCLAAHSLSSMEGCPSRYGKIPTRVLSLWNKIPLWHPGRPCDELFLFTDGSYTAANRKPTWAVVLVIQGLSMTTATDKVARAAIGLKALLATQGKQIYLHKVLAHDNCALNDMADAAAKAVERDPAVTASALTFENFWSAINEGIVDHLWMVPDCPHTAASMPPLREDGTWSRANCQISCPKPLTRLFGMQPEESQCGIADICLRLLQYNPLSLRGSGATELMEIGLRKHKIDVAGFQETRLDMKGISTIGSYWVLSAACTDKGIGGAQLWIRHSKHWDRQAFSIVHAEPQILIVIGTYRGVRVQLVSAHAPPACSPEPAILDWWSHFSTTLHRAPPGCAPLLFLDANATFAREAGVQETVDSKPTCANSKQLLQLASAKGLYLSPHSLKTGEALQSWTSPQGHKKLIDYLAVPDNWEPAFEACPTPCLGDLHADIDHQPVMAQVTAKVQARVDQKGPSLEAKIWGNPVNHQVAAAAACTCPIVQWETDSTAHVDTLHRHLHGVVSAQAVIDTKPPRNPALSAPTLALIRAHRHLRRCTRHAMRTADRAFLQLCLHAWAYKDRTASRLLAADRRDRIAAARRWATQYRHGKQMRRAMWRDKAEFTRAGIQEARSAGPSTFAHKLRAILRTGRRYRAPPLLPCLSDEPECPMTKDAVADSFGAYFAKAERAKSQPVAALLQRSCQARPVEGCLTGKNLPCLAELAAGFASLQNGRAPGLSGLVPEVFRSNPLMLAIHYYPVMCKLLLRDPAPFQWRGGASVCVPKPGKPATQHQGYRAIMLFECDNKALQKAMRPSLLGAMDRMSVPDQMGGRPRRTLAMPSACVKAHLHALRRTKQSGAVIFIDSAAAYYSIAKDILELTPQQKADSRLLHCRAALLFDDVRLQSEFVAIVQGSTNELEEAMTPELRRFLQQQLDTTWYVSRRNNNSAYVAGSGTAPGSPLADVMFSLVFGRVLKKTAAFLRDQGLQASIATTAPGGHGFTPTWADDVSILLQASAPETVMTAVAQTMSFFLAELRQAGLKANMGPGKTEALLSINGPGARRVRQQIFCQDSPAIDLRSGDGEGAIRVTASYEYLGSLVQADGHALPAILHRRRLAREMFRPIKNRMLRNPALTMQEKIDLVRSRILTRFFYGSGLWTLGTQREQDTVEETVYGFYRGAFRHILAVSGQGYSNTELAGALCLPTPEELLNVERTRTVVQLAREGLSTVLQELAQDVVWWTQAEEAVRAIGLTETGASLSDFLPIAVHLPPSEVRAKCKLYLTNGIRSRWIPLAKVQPRPVCDTVQITAASGPQLPWACPLCPCAFATRKDLAVHESRRHGKRAQHVLCAVGS
ncbi:unnamed protein product, partial [Symbiodinium necroappetens]